MSSIYEIGVIGLGKFGYHFAESMIQLGHKVLGIDNDVEKVKQAQGFLTQAYRADAMNKSVLIDLGISELDHVLVSVGDSITASTMIAMYLLELKIPKIWVKAANDDHQKLLDKIGVHKVFIPEKLAAMQLANRLAIPGFIDYLPFDNNVMIKELIVKQWKSKTLRQINLTNVYNVQVIAVKKKNDSAFKYIPKADDPFEEGDILVVLGNNESIAALKA